MPKTYQKRPSLSEFIKACDKYNGNKTKIAKFFGVSRQSVCNWCNAYPKYADSIDEYKGRLLDKCLISAEALAIGIPKTKKNPKTGKESIVGWKVKPDGLMLRYLIGVLGRREGFGESIDITSKGESIKPDPIIVEVIDRREQVDRETNAADEE